MMSWECTSRRATGQRDVGRLGGLGVSWDGPGRGWRRARNRIGNREERREEERGGERRGLVGWERTWAWTWTWAWRGRSECGCIVYRCSIHISRRMYARTVAVARTPAMVRFTRLEASEHQVRSFHFGALSAADLVTYLLTHLRTYLLTYLLAYQPSTINP